MPYLFRTYKTMKDPATSKRVPMLDSKSRKVPHEQWRFVITDCAGRRKKMTGYASRSETEKLAARIQCEQDEIRRGYRPAPRASDAYASRPFPEVVAEYMAEGRAHGGLRGFPWAAEYASIIERYLGIWAERLNLKNFGDLSAGILPRAEKVLQEIQKSGRAPKTLAGYRDTLFAFCEWGVQRGYLENNPVKNLKGFDLTPLTIRRALTAQEINLLFENCRPEWRLVYETAIFTGLRRKELRNLKVKHLDAEGGGLHLEAAWTKNRRPGFQPLPSGLLQRLLKAAQGREPSDRLIHVPYNTAEQIRKGFAKGRDQGPGDRR